MAALRSIWFNLALYSGSLVWTVFAITASPLVYAWARTVGGKSRSQAVRKFIWLYGRGWVGLISLLTSVKIQGRTLPTPCIIVSNHASFFDIYFMGAQPVWNVCMVVRNWPFKIFFYRPFMLAAGYVNTEQGEPGEALEQTLRAIGQGASMLFYPEGTRGEGGKLKRFRTGAFHAALQANVPVVPFCISGTDKLLPKGERWARPAAITIRLLAPVFPGAYRSLPNGATAMRNHVKALMAEAIEEMSAHAS